MRKIWLAVMVICTVLNYADNGNKIWAADLNKEVTFENEFIRVSVNSVSKGKGKNKIALSLIIENKTNNDIYPAFAAFGDGFPVIMGNDGSTPVQHWTKFMGIPSIGANKLENQSKYAKIQANNKMTTNLIFEYEDSIDSNEFSFTSEMYLFNEQNPKKPRQFSMTLSSIKLQ